jgi:hypothetical protein
MFEDRVPYITEAPGGVATIIPRKRKIHHNFIIGNYNSQECIDTDDGSSYYDVYENVLAYGNRAIYVFDKDICSFVWT